MESQRRRTCFTTRAYDYFFKTSRSDIIRNWEVSPNVEYFLNEVNMTL